MTTKTIEIEVTTWDDVDARLAATQAELRYGTSRQQGERIVADLAELRGDLAALRAYERSQRGAPIVTRVLDDPPPSTPSHPPAATETARETSISSGFTGDMCEDCGSARMVRTGTCQTCQDCFATTGCS